MKQVGVTITKMVSRYLLILIPVILLTACQSESTLFGVRESTWSTLCPDQRQAAIDSYNARMEAEEQNPPYDRCNQYCVNQPE